MAINKVKYGETTLIDLTGTTATSNTILQGYGAYGKDGVWIDGVAKQNTGMESVTQDQEGFVVLDDDEGNQIAVNPLSVTENGTYRAAIGNAYNPVTVNVPSPDFIVTLTKNSNDEWEPDCTFAEAKAAYVNGTKRTGTMPNNGAVTGSITAVDGEYTIPLGYHDGSGKVSISATDQSKLIPENIRQGVVVLGITGTMSGEEGVVAQSRTVTPTVAQQTITPETGYNYLSQVVVNAIPYTETANTYGTTVTIG